MSDQPVEVKKKVRAIRGRDKKRRKTYLLQVGRDEWYRLRRTDLPSLFLEGIIPTPILRAVDTLQDFRRNVAADNIADALGNLSKEDRDAFLELMRRCAVSCVIEPKMTHSKRASLADEDLLWVGGISDVDGEGNEDQRGDVETPVLLTIWKAVLGEAGIVTMSDDEANEFRESESESPDSLVRDGDGVRTEAVVVDSHAGSETSTPKTTRLDYH